MDDQGTKPLSAWQQDNSFLPEDYVRGKAERRANLLSIVLFGVMMFAVVAAFFATNKRWMNVRDEKQSINALYVQEAGKIDELKELEMQRDELIQKAEVTAALVERVPRSLLFAEIVRRMPDEVKLLELDLTSEQIKKVASKASKKSAGVRTLSGAGGKTKGGAPEKAEQNSLVPEYRQNLKLVGVGRDNDNIADYIESLKNCAILTNVELQFIKETTIENTELRKFELRARIRPGIDARGLVNPDNPIDLPEVLSPEDLVPAKTIFLPPSQTDAEGNPLPGADGAPAKPEGPLDFFGSALGALRSFGEAAEQVVAPANTDQPEIPWEQIPASDEDDQGAAEPETDAAVPFAPDETDEADADAEPAADADTEADPVADPEADAETDADTETDADSEAGAETETSDDAEADETAETTDDNDSNEDDASDDDAEGDAGTEGEG